MALTTADIHAAAGQWLGLAVLAAVGWLLYRVSTRRQPGEAA